MTRLDWLIDLIDRNPEEQNEYQVYKALVCLKTLSSDWDVVEQLYRRNIMSTLRKVLDRQAPSLVRVVSQLITRLIQAPRDMRLWLKFDSPNPAVNSAGRQMTLRVHGKPGRMPPDRGIYNNWGAFFDLGDSLEIPNGFSHKGNLDKEKPQLEWTIYFQTIMPFKYREQKTRTLA